MPQKKKNPDYDPEKILNELMETISELYIGNGNCGNGSINQIANEFGISRIKVRKLLITVGVYQSDTCDWINQLHSKGKSIQEIQEITLMSYSAVKSYLPYEKTVYNMEEASANAERIKTYRERQQARERVIESFQEEMASIQREAVLWDAIIKFAGYPFFTMKKLKFTYHVKGYEIFVTRKEKSITRSSVNMAFQKAIDLERNVTGPKKLETFGASYLYAIFQRIGVINNNKK